MLIPRFLIKYWPIQDETGRDGMGRDETGRDETGRDRTRWNEKIREVYKYVNA